MHAIAVRRFLRKALPEAIIWMTLLMGVSATRPQSPRDPRLRNATRTQAGEPTGILMLFFLFMVLRPPDPVLHRFPHQSPVLA